MSISLDVEPYCEDCFNFEPIRHTFTAESFDCSRRAITTVYCEHKSKCDQICKYLKNQMRKKTEAKNG